MTQLPKKCIDIPLNRPYLHAHPGASPKTQNRKNLPLNCSNSVKPTFFFFLLNKHI